MYVALNVRLKPEDILILEERQLASYDAVACGVQNSNWTVL
jgi:hypothetical protein